jgi:hypothetical protein
MSETQKTKPEAVALLLNYLAARAGKRLLDENGCTVKSEHGGYSIWADDLHMVTVPDRNPSEREVQLAYRVLGFDEFRKYPLEFASSRCLGNIDHFRAEIGRAANPAYVQNRKQELFTLIQEHIEWLRLLRIVMSTTENAADNQVEQGAV